MHTLSHTNFVSSISYANENSALENKKAAQNLQLKEAVNSFAALLWEEVLKSSQRSIDEINGENSNKSSIGYFTEMLNKELIAQMSNQENCTDNSLSSEIYRQLSNT